MEKDLRRSWWFLGGLTVIFIYLHVFMEWLFFVTEPSFLSGMELYENLLILTVTPLLPASIALGVIFVLWILSKFAKNYQHEGIFIATVRIVPAFILTTIFLILIDNFTYTLFTLGIPIAHHRKNRPSSHPSALSRMKTGGFLYRISDRVSP